MRCLTTGGDECRAVSDDQGKVFDRSHPAIYWIDSFFSQERLVHEQAVEKNVYPSGFRFCHSNHPVESLTPELTGEQSMLKMRAALVASPVE